jgi:hypothetical protein
MSDDGIGRRLSVAAYNSMMRIPGFKGILPRLNRKLLAYRFSKDLVRLNDVLSETELADNYWVFSGMLLGWAREGQLLARDTDADFGILLEDLPKLMRTVPMLAKAGFHPYRQYRNNDGNLVELMFRRHRAIYDFSVFFPQGESLHYFVFGWPPDQLYEVEKVLPAQERMPFEFLGRTWLRHADFERELDLTYGDWRTPHSDWDYLRDGPNSISLKAWVNTDVLWID